MQRILFPLFFVLAFHLKAQLKSQLYVDGEPYEMVQFDDTLKLTNHINKQLINWINEGYYFAGVDSLSNTPDHIMVYLHQGAKLKANVSSQSAARLQKYMVRRLREFTNTGYPFASIKLDSTLLSDGVLSGSLQVNSGPEISYDSAYFFTQVKTNHSYIYKLLDIVPGDAFSDRNYSLVSEKVKRSSFLSLNRPTDLSFKSNLAKTFLDLRESTSSSFQGVIGLQQEQDGRTTAVGALELDIQNLFRSGKQFRLAWERFAQESQSLELYYKHPFVLESKISPSFNFELLKQDTTFLSRKTSIGIHTFIAPRIELLAEFESTNGTLLTTDLEMLRQSALADFKRRVYGLQLSKGYLTTLSTRTNGTIWNVSISAGNKTVQRNLNLPDEYYDSIQTASNFYRLEAAFTYQLKVSRRQAFYHHIQTGTLQNDELLQNELYRLGGLASLRGFNEKNFFAKSYLLSRTEFRSFFEDRSFAYVFYDQLLFSSIGNEDQPFGVGLGFALETSAGQFSFALALGKSEDQQIAFANMKAHFGYVSRF